MKWVEALLAAALALCAGDSRAQDGWARIEAGHELRYPRDHGAHEEYRTEWWYFTGQVRDERGRELGFQLTFFRQGLDARPAAPGESPLRARQVLAGHLAIADIATGRVHFAERLRREGAGLAQASREGLAVTLDDWSATYEDERVLLRAADPATGSGLALELRPTKALVLHGAGGVSAKGAEPGNASAYVSWTRLEVRGSVSVAGSAREVSGEGWFDHEFGSSVLGPGVVGWDWFGLQLDDGRELMLFTLRDEQGEARTTSAGTLVERDGSTRALVRADFELEVLDHWRSPRSAARYPSRWRLRVPSAALELTLSPRVADAELASPGSTGVIYWEGPLRVEGSVSGRGYAELTGYAGSMSGRF